jgi:antitoxin component of MazEF toxin-antitoxin module
MAMRVQRRGDEYCVVIPREELEALQLSDGAEVEVRAVNGHGNGQGSGVEIRYVTVDEALQSYRETLPQHREAYIELAK